ncbi:hypothetical protein KSC_013630 [Ktedonobacter sp. SOSP1-52]|nr:hypothetical protein KSC_013630 [Ktedonobacter sp. SOSP1-52]
MTEASRYIYVWFVTRAKKGKRVWKVAPGVAFYTPYPIFVGSMLTWT